MYLSTGKYKYRCTWPQTLSVEDTIGGTIGETIEIISYSTDVDNSTHSVFYWLYYQLLKIKYVLKSLNNFWT